MASSSATKKRKGKSAQIHNNTRFKSYYHEDQFNNEKHLPLTYTSFIRGKDISFSPEAIHKVLSLRNSPLNNVASYHDRKNANELRPDDILRDLCIPGARWITYDNRKPHFLRRTDLQNMARGWYEFVTRSIMPTTNRSEVNTKRAMLVHSIIIVEDIQVDEIIANQIYKFTKKTNLRAKLPFPGIVKRLCNRAKASIPEDTLIPVERPIDGKMMMRVRRTRQAPAPPPQEEEEEDAEMPQAPQVQQSVPSNFMDSFNNAMAAM
ncbi:hypothetical protein PIB30_061465 [Stylosanthes scabra]|uniref:Putative plant transposon protein domain-containing protein n=1 Tax=Stylosanthes scabra TaxID=79078 RepID=A0ABU6VK27_9FABA|nr:hypothetical protein [Stylosanthes scabra]